MCNAKQILTNSRMSCFRDCPKRHYIRYELGLNPEDDNSLPRRFGSALHLAFELWDKGESVLPAADGLDNVYDQAMLAATFKAHLDRYMDIDPTPVAAELQFSLKVVNPETGKPSTTWVINGVIDRIVKLDDGRLALMEYKTTTRDFSPGAEYWNKLHMDQQLSIYVIAARSLGYNIETILYDVARRPMLRPKMATPEDARKYKKNGSLYANQRTKDETPEDFTMRVAEDIQERPDYYFSRIEIARLDQDLLECSKEVWMMQKTIRSCQKSDSWYRNPNACYGFFKCDYLPICMNENLETITPLGFVRSDNIHPELDDAKDQG